MASTRLRKLSLDVVYQKCTEQHKKRAKDDQRDEIPTEVADGRINSRNKCRGSAGGCTVFVIPRTLDAAAQDTASAIHLKSSKSALSANSFVITTPTSAEMHAQERNSVAVLMAT